MILHSFPKVMHADEADIALSIGSLIFLSYALHRVPPLGPWLPFGRMFTCQQTLAPASYKLRRELGLSLLLSQAYLAGFLPVIPSLN